MAKDPKETKPTLTEKLIHWTALCATILTFVYIWILMIIVTALSFKTAYEFVQPGFPILSRDCPLKPAKPLKKQ